MRDRLIEILDNYGDDISLCDICKRPSEDCQGCKNEQLAEFLLANGVIVPPCKVGQKVWCIVDGVSFNPLEASIYSITVQTEGIIMRCGVKGYYGVSYMATDFGKKFFASKEEAEQALKGGAE